MRQTLQKTNSTHYDRYPNVFSVASDLATFKCSTEDKAKLNILSFGCSYGEEVKCLEEKYFKGHNIEGVDISEECIKQCKLLGLNSNFYTISDFLQLKKEYDFVFAMSVLCTMLHDKKEAPLDFNLFDQTCYDIDDQTCYDIDRLIKVGGYFIDYNSNYYFLDSEVGYKYIPISNYRIDKSNEQVIKYKKDGLTEIQDNNICIFKKIKK